MEPVKDKTVRQVILATGVDVGSYAVKLATVSQNKKGELTVHALTTKELLPKREGDTDETRRKRTGEALKAALAQHGSKLGWLTSALPRHLVTVRQVLLPTTQTQEIADMLTFDAERHLPYPPENAKIGFQVLEEDEKHNSYVMLLAAENSELDQHLETLQNCGLRADQVDVDFLALGELYRNRAGGQTGWGLLHLGYEWSQLILFQHGRAYYSHVFPVGGQRLEPTREEGEEPIRELADFTLAEGPQSERYRDWLHQLIRQVVWGLQVCKAEKFGGDVGELGLSGGLASAPGLAAALQRHLRLGVEVCQPFAGMEVKGKKEKLSPQYALATGLALRGLDFVPGALNLLPDRIVDARSHTQQKRFIRNVAACLILSVGMAGTGLGLLAEQRFRERSQLQATLDELQPKVRELNTMKEELDNIGLFLDEENSALKVLKELYEKLPEHIQITDLTYEKKNALTIRGRAYTNTDVDNVIAILNESPYFKKVGWKGSNQVKVYEANLTEFNIECVLKSKGKKPLRKKKRGAAGTAETPAVSASPTAAAGDTE